jgi:SAM-dependent methyltransferase
MDAQRERDLQAGYSRVAGEYAARIYDELAHKPLDRALLDRFAERVRGVGPVCDLGCGPGQVARYLHDRGVDVLGVDLSPGMVAQAQRLNPGISFQTGNMLALDVPDASWAGIAAFYSIIHIPRADLPRALGELHRVLRPGGVLLLAFHIGQDAVHLDEWWGEPVSLDFFFFEPEEIAGHLRGAGFVVEEQIERAPYPDVEHQSRRAYILAHKAQAALDSEISR